MVITESRSSYLHFGCCHRPSSYKVSFSHRNLYVSSALWSVRHTVRYNSIVCRLHMWYKGVSICILTYRNVIARSYVRCIQTELTLRRYVSSVWLNLNTHCCTSTYVHLYYVCLCAVSYFLYLYFTRYTTGRHS